MPRRQTAGRPHSLLNIHALHCDVPNMDGFIFYKKNLEALCRPNLSLLCICSGERLNVNAFVVRLTVVGTVDKQFHV